MTHLTQGMCTLSERLKELQAKWYQILLEDGFEDIEDWEIGGFEVLSNGIQVSALEGGRPLKAWSGISMKIIDYLPIESVLTQPPLKEIQSIGPIPIISQEKELLNREDFDDICAGITHHGNHSLTKIQVRGIWEMYVEHGYSDRRIGKELGINDTLVWRIRQHLTKWAEIMSEGN